jgi:hypothetical protein
MILSFTEHRMGADLGAALAVDASFSIQVQGGFTI